MISKNSKCDQKKANGWRTRHLVSIFSQCLTTFWTWQVSFSHSVRWLFARKTDIRTYLVFRCFSMLLCLTSCWSRFAGIISWFKKTQTCLLLAWKNGTRNKFQKVARWLDKILNSGASSGCEITKQKAPETNENINVYFAKPPLSRQIQTSDRNCHQNSSLVTCQDAFAPLCHRLHGHVSRAYPPSTAQQKCQHDRVQTNPAMTCSYKAYGRRTSAVAI